MRRRARNIGTAIAIGSVLCLIAQDLTAPLIGISVLGLFDRIFGAALAARFPRLEAAR
ncbi:hypothetical protein [Rhizobium sp. G21]|uniref:hypothetical protein n=1 Tax=Rhizobium sp. G21 TaxID=2758439 RepID=UPI0015FF884B|nr:hypothetical protein [Rhizobium sp. G21]MBB1247916.1 hypothetical protein [Rhizobium sp. G21]